MNKQYLKIYKILTDNHPLYAEASPGIQHFPDVKVISFYNVSLLISSPLRETKFLPHLVLYSATRAIRLLSCSTTAPPASMGAGMQV